MKVIIAGSREITDYELVEECIKDSEMEITEVVSGTCRGVDKLGERWARENKIQIKQFPANWAEKGRDAGKIRNKEMAEYAEALIAIWDGESLGTKNMIETAKKTGLKIRIFEIGKMKGIE